LRLAAVILVAIALTAALYALRANMLSRAPALAVSFAHDDHREQNCIACHHNFADATGDGMCFDCHKTDPAIAGDVEEMFHDLCRGCHVDERHAGSESGPVRQCFDCHEGDDLP
jgi:hypothetical protein